MSITMLTRFIRKLRSKRGDSIAEVLVAVLVSSAGLLVLATMLSASRRIVEDSREQVKEYIQAENVIASQRGTSDYTMPEAGAGKIIISSDFALTEEESRGPDGKYYIPVTVQVNTFRKNQPIISYKKSGG